MRKGASSRGKSQAVGNILIILSGILLIGSSIAKFAHVPKLVTELGQFGFDNSKLMLIAVLELVGATAFLVPVTRSHGLLLLSSYMGGAIATHIQHNTPFIQPAVILAIIWLGAALRHPEVFWSLRAAPGSTQEPLMTSRDALSR